LFVHRAVSEKLANKYTMGIGTPTYMAPEILTKKQYDLKADIIYWGQGHFYTNQNAPVNTPAFLESRSPTPTLRT
jgi:serine/threonine protein kinase